MNDAVVKASAALAMIAALASDTKLQAEKDGFAVTLTDGSRVEMTLSSSGPVMTFVDPKSEKRRPFVLNAFGDCHSPAYWAPTGLIDPWHYGEDWTRLEELALASLIERVRTLRTRVSLASDDEVLSFHGRTTAAIDYLRATTGYSKPWIVSCAYPFEVFADQEDHSGECTFALVHQPPGFRDIGECAVASVDRSEADFSFITIRPAMLTFANSVSKSVAGTLSALEVLRASGFSGEEIAELGETAARLRGHLSDQ